MTSNITLSKNIPEDGSIIYKITIFTTRVERNLTKALVIFTPPKNTKDQGGSSVGDKTFGPATTMLIDLLMKFEYRITVDGYVSDEFGTASSGTSSTLVDSSKTWVADAFNTMTINITGGTGAGQSKTISDTSTSTITVTGNWTTNPDSTSTYEIEGSAPTLAKYLEYMFEAGGTFTLSYAGTDYTGNSDKVSILEETEDESTATKYSVKFTFVKGDDMHARS